MLRCRTQDPQGNPRETTMRIIPSALQEKLDSGVTTLCRCWIVTRRDGVKQGFTDHDEDIDIAGVTCRANTGLTGSEITARGLAAVVKRC